MKVEYYLCFVVALLGCTSCNSANLQIEDAVLWKISGNGLEKPSYLLGTNHTVELGFLDSITGFWDIYNLVECLLVEVDLTRAEIAKEVESTKEDDLMMYLMPKDTTYQMLYSPSDYNLIDSVMIINKMFNYQRFMPGFVAIEFADRQIMKTMKGLMDLELMLKAKEDQKEIVGLDNLEMLNNYNDTLGDLHNQAKDLLQVVNNLDIMLEEVYLFDSLYRHQKITSMSEDSMIYRVSSKLGVKEIEETKSFQNFCTRRNIDWLKKIPFYISRKTSLIAVGVRHLINKNGLIVRLRELGYTVTPILSK